MNRRTLWLLTSIVMILFGVTLLSIVALHKTSEVSASNTQPVTIIQKPQPFSAVEVTIPSVNIDAPIIEGSIDNGVWKLDNNAVLKINVADSSNTKQAILLYAHDFIKLFGSLRFVKIDDQIYVKDDQGKVKTYQIISKEDIKPTQVDKLIPDLDNELILYSCDGVMDSQRVLVKAKLL